ncbi:MAG: hypothetical protein ABIQ18_20415 [Umezawaea sp.]
MAILADLDSAAGPRRRLRLGDKTARAANSLRLPNQGEHLDEPVG